MSELAKAVERLINNYGKLTESLERDAKREASELDRAVNKAQANILRYVRKDLQNMVELFGEGRTK